MNMLKKTKKGLGRPAWTSELGIWTINCSSLAAHLKVQLSATQAVTHPTCYKTLIKTYLVLTFVPWIQMMSRNNSLFSLLQFHLFQGYVYLLPLLHIIGFPSWDNPFVCLCLCQFVWSCSCTYSSSHFKGILCTPLFWRGLYCWL